MGSAPSHLAGGGRLYGRASFQPLQIVLKVVQLQLVFYFAFATAAFILSSLTGAPWAAPLLLRPASFTVASASGWCNLLALFTAAASAAGAMPYVVERARKAIDFAFTVFFVHLVASWVAAEAFPLNSTWWLAHAVAFVVLSALGELLCLRREMADISVDDILSRREASRRHEGAATAAAPSAAAVAAAGASAAAAAAGAAAGSGVAVGVGTGLSAGAGAAVGAASAGAGAGGATGGVAMGAAAGTGTTAFAPALSISVSAIATGANAASALLLAQSPLGAGVASAPQFGSVGFPAASSLISSLDSVSVAVGGAGLGSGSLPSGLHRASSAGSYVRLSMPEGKGGPLLPGSVVFASPRRDALGFSMPPASPTDGAGGSPAASALTQLLPAAASAAVSSSFSAGSAGSSGSSAAGASAALGLSALAHGAGAGSSSIGTRLVSRRTGLGDPSGGAQLPSSGLGGALPSLDDPTPRKGKMTVSSRGGSFLSSLAGLFSEGDAKV